jgi:hypothetical protein
MPTTPYLDGFKFEPEIKRVVALHLKWRARLSGFQITPTCLRFYGSAARGW